MWFLFGVPGYKPRAILWTAPCHSGYKQVISVCSKILIYDKRLVVWNLSAKSFGNPQFEHSVKRKMTIRKRIRLFPLWHSRVQDLTAAVKSSFPRGEEVTLELLCLLKRTKISIILKIKWTWFPDLNYGCETLWLCSFCLYNSSFLRTYYWKRMFIKLFNRK